MRFILTPSNQLSPRDRRELHLRHQTSEILRRQVIDQLLAANGVGTHQSEETVAGPSPLSLGNAELVK